MCIFQDSEDSFFNNSKNFFNKVAQKKEVTWFVANEYYISMYPYASDEIGDLTFDQGETILVIAKDGDWWTGVIGNRSGIFPSNYVQKCETVPIAEPVEEIVSTSPTVTSSVLETTTTTSVTPTPKSPAAVSPVPIEEPQIIEQKTTPVSIEPQITGDGRAATPDFTSLSSQVESGSGEESDTKSKSRKPLIATVIAPYQATSSEQLSLQRGQLIMIRKKTATGWWEGELQAKGKKRQIGWFPASYVKLLGGRGSQPASRKTSESGLNDNLLERVVALYQYVAQNEDELSFEKDDLVTILAKDEPSWWKGECKGAVGLFPSNYVGPIYENSLSSGREVKLG